MRCASTPKGHLSIKPVGFRAQLLIVESSAPQDPI